MKTYFKIHIQYPCPLTQGTINEIDSYLPSTLRGRIKVDEEDNQIGSLILSTDDSGNPELDEISQFLLELDGTDCQPFFGYPKEDLSNAVTDESGVKVWTLLDDCEVNEPTT